MDRQLLVDDAAGIAHTRLGVPARHVDALDDKPRLGWEDAQHLARATLVAAADDDDVVALLDLHLRHALSSGPPPSRRHCRPEAGGPTTSIEAGTITAPLAPAQPSS